MNDARMGQCGLQIEGRHASPCDTCPCKDSVEQVFWVIIGGISCRAGDFRDAIAARHRLARVRPKPDVMGSDHRCVSH